MDIKKILSWFKFLSSKYGWRGIKGLYAEKLLLIILKFYFPKAFILENVTIPFGNYTSQIDFIVLLPTGIFVIEVKNYKGFITATNKHDKWFIKYHNSKYANSYIINSPLAQNQVHCKALSKVLRIPEYKFFNVISFTDRATLRIAKDEYLPNVCTGKQLINYLKEERPCIYSSADLKHINEQIQLHRLSPTLKTDYHHVQLIKKRHTDRIEKQRQKNIGDIQAIQDEAHRKKQP